MAHLPEDRGEVGDDLPTRARRQGPPDLAGLDGHAPSLSPAVATRSSIASRQSLVGMAARRRRPQAGRRDRQHQQDAGAVFYPNMAGRLHGSAGRQQAKASPMKRMGGIGDLDLVRKCQVAFSARGISSRYRSKGSTGGCPNAPGGRQRRAEPAGRCVRQIDHARLAGCGRLWHRLDLAHAARRCQPAR